MELLQRKHRSLADSAVAGTVRCNRASSNVRRPANSEDGGVHRDLRCTHGAVRRSIRHHISAAGPGHVSCLMLSRQTMTLILDD